MERRVVCCKLPFCQEAARFRNMFWSLSSDMNIYVKMNPSRSSAEIGQFPGWTTRGQRAHQVKRPIKFLSNESLRDYSVTFGTLWPWLIQYIQYIRIYHQPSCWLGLVSSGGFTYKDDMIAVIIHWMMMALSSSSSSLHFIPSLPRSTHAALPVMQIVLRHGRNYIFIIILSFICLLVEEV